MDKPASASITSSCAGQLPPLAFIAFSTASLVGGNSEIGAVRLPFRIIVVGLFVPGDEFFRERGGVRVGEIERVMAKQHTFRRKLLLHKRVLPAGRGED